MSRVVACWLPFVVLVVSAFIESPLGAAGTISGMSAQSRPGQIFLTWQEKETPQGTTFNVYTSQRPITALRDARRLASHVERHSARDWWEDPASFATKNPPRKALGFRIGPATDRLDPAGGLFVHTLESGQDRPLYFAVTSSNNQGIEDQSLVPGANSLVTPVRPRSGPVVPIWQGKGEPHPAGAARHKPLCLNLHAKGGVVPGMEYLVFGDRTLGWREGLPFKFSVRMGDDGIVVRPTDRVWINRPHVEAGDGGTPAIWTFWYGYNSRIDDRAEMGRGTPTNYTERRLLWILDWVRRHYQPDEHAWSCSGSSMGGCGTISFGLRHPELFAGLHAHVPIVSYTYRGVRGSATRLEPSCWIGPIPADLKTDEGVPLLQRMDSERFVRESRVDLPPLFVIHGRQDRSIPWENNPPFYRAMRAARQPLFVYWDNGEHGTCGRNAPADVRDWQKRFRLLRHDESYPVFTNTSTDRDPGDGRPENGDVVGWINRGMDWREIADTAGSYAVTLIADYPGIEYPVRTDVTFRGLQQFRVQPGERLLVQVAERPATVSADLAGHVTIAGVAIPSAAGVRVRISRP